jgi:thioesterase domain-containing protein/acyl carrier protein
LGGFSFGGSVAFEMARQLEQRGETVSWLVLLDAYAPGSQALQSLGRLAWDGFLPQLIANLLIRQWGGSARLTTGSLPKNDPEAQIRIAARQVRSACNTPQTEEQIAAVMANAIRLATRNAELQEGYQPRPCHAIQRAVLFRNRRGFVGPDSDLALPSVVVDDKAPDHGWTQWLPAPPLIHEVDADHFSLGLEPAIGIVGRRLAELLRAGLQPSNGHPNGAERLRVFDVVKGHVLRILPDVPAAAVTPEVRLKDLGANSLDRIEVATCAMEDLDLDLPRTRLAGVDNLQSLVEVLVAALPKGGNGS